MSENKVFKEGGIVPKGKAVQIDQRDLPLLVARPGSARPLTVDQARTQDLERRGLHGAVVRSDGLNRAVVECRFEDLDHVLGEEIFALPSVWPECEDEEAE